MYDLVRSWQNFQDILHRHDRADESIGQVTTMLASTTLVLKNRLLRMNLEEVYFSFEDIVKL